MSGKTVCRRARRSRGARGVLVGRTSHRPHVGTRNVCHGCGRGRFCTDQPLGATDDAAAPAIDPATGTPAWCATLSASSALTGLPDAFRALADPATADSGRSVLAAAAADLQAIVPQTTVTVTDATKAVILSLNAVAANGLADEDATNTLSSTMIAFGNEVQAVCQFAGG